MLVVWLPSCELNCHVIPYGCVERVEGFIGNVHLTQSTVTVFRPFVTVLASELRSRAGDLPRGARSLRPR
eukprot:6171895-Pleurochrysis_carterae.AAC.3